MNHISKSLPLIFSVQVLYLLYSHKLFTQTTQQYCNNSLKARREPKYLYKCFMNDVNDAARNIKTEPHTYIHTHTYEHTTHTHTHTHTHIHTRTHTYNTHVHIHGHTHTHARTHTHIHTHTHLHTYIIYTCLCSYESSSVTALVA